MDYRPLQRDSFQCAWVDDDVESASYFWASNSGVGPFLLFDFGDAFSYILYRGELGELRVVLALSHCDRTQSELTQPVSQLSVCPDSVSIGTTGFHHVCAAPSDPEADLVSFESIGCPAALPANSWETQFAYSDY